jgi:hypothetical protein
VYAINDQSDWISFDKYDINGTFLDSGSSYLSNARDSLVREPYVYLLNEGSYEVLRLDASDLSKNPIDTFGTQDDDTPPVDAGEFFGPRLFVAVPNIRLTLIDEEDFADKNRLSSFDEQTLGGNWEIYGVTGSGQGQFRFFVDY